MSEVVTEKRVPEVAAMADEIADHNPEEFRNYKESALQDRVSKFYTQQHLVQTFDVVSKINAQFADAPVIEMTIMEALDLLDTLVDESDPDLDAGQIYHAYQTAEAARQIFPEEKWLHVVGLIHDAGKVLGLEKFGGFPQEFVVGDTFPLGTPFSTKIVFADTFQDNPDLHVPEYQKGDTGIYAPHVGFSNVMMSYGHDEYLYQVLMDSKTSLPEEALYIVRFHSFYAHHQMEAYKQLMNETDARLLDTLRRFQPCDLYSKSTNFPPIDELRPYYAQLMAEFGLDKPLRFRKLTLPKLHSAAPAC